MLWYLISCVFLKVISRSIAIQPQIWKAMNSSTNHLMSALVHDFLLYRPIALLLTPSAFQTKLYIEDWIGLRTLDEAGRVHFISVPGKHLGISEEDMKKHVVPYLKDQASTEDSTNKAGFWRIRKVKSEGYWVNHDGAMCNSGGITVSYGIS